MKDIRFKKRRHEHVETVASDSASLYSTDWTSAIYDNQTASQSQLSVSTTATRSNNIGPGRTMGIVLESLGRRVETRLSRIAVARGQGPNASLTLVRAALSSVSENEREDREVMNRLLEAKDVCKACRRLIKHMQYEFIPRLIIKI